MGLYWGTVTLTFSAVLTSQLSVGDSGRAHNWGDEPASRRDSSYKRVLGSIGGRPAKQMTGARQSLDIKAAYRYANY